MHADRPDIYKDDNHKPEMAIALTPFEALIGFRPLVQIRAFITRKSHFTVNKNEVKQVFISILLKKLASYGSI